MPRFTRTCFRNHYTIYFPTGPRITSLDDRIAERLRKRHWTTLCQLHTTAHNVVTVAIMCSRHNAVTVATYRARLCTVMLSNVCSLTSRIARAGAWRPRGASQTRPAAPSPRRPVRARPGQLSALSVFLCKSAFYGGFVWARRALSSQKRRFPAREVTMYTDAVADVGGSCFVPPAGGGGL